MSKDQYSDEIRKSHRICGFCSTNTHDYCKAAYRNGDGSILMCGCPCALTKAEQCSHCFTTDKVNLTRPWLCGDRDACAARVQERLANDQSFQRINSFLRGTIIKNALVSPRSKRQCLCCDEPTSGGFFLPGHDSRWLKFWHNRVLASEVTKDEALAAVSEISAKLAEKLGKRLA